MRLNNEIIAHRGASGHEFENSMAAFKKAIELGSDMIEFDVQKSKDGFVILHDHDLDRVTDTTGPVSEKNNGRASGKRPTQKRRHNPYTHGSLSTIH